MTTVYSPWPALTWRATTAADARAVRPRRPRIACRCACHEEWGGGAHPGERCSCKGGTGQDPWGVPAPASAPGTGTMPVMTEPVTPSPYMTRAEVAGHFGVDDTAVTLRPDTSVGGEPGWLRERIESLSSPAEPLSIWG